MGWRVVVRGLVKKFGRLGENDETVCEAFRDPKLVFILCGQISTDPAAESWRGTAQVDSDVENLAFHYANELSLGVLNLVVQAPYNAFSGAGVVVLNKGDGSADGAFEDTLIEAFKKEAAGIAKNARFE